MKTYKIKFNQLVSVPSEIEIEAENASQAFCLYSTGGFNQEDVEHDDSYEWDILHNIYRSMEEIEPQEIIDAG